MISISIDGNNMPIAKSFTTQFEGVYASMGVHPHEAKTWCEANRDFILANQHDPKIVAIGEIGLDYHYEYSSKQEQWKAFEEQLSLAVQTQLPVIIHTREAEDDTMAIIRPYIGKIPSIVFHSFSSSLDLADFATGHGCYLGFNGMITFKNAENVRAALSLAPLELIVVETDAPYLSPVPHRGHENHSARLPHIAKKVAEIKKISLSQLEAILWQNSLRLFPRLA